MFFTTVVIKPGLKFMLVGPLGPNNLATLFVRFRSLLLMVRKPKELDSPPAQILRIDFVGLSQGVLSQFPEKT